MKNKRNTKPYVTIRIGARHNSVRVGNTLYERAFTNRRKKHELSRFVIGDLERNGFFAHSA